MIFFDIFKKRFLRKMVQKHVIKDFHSTGIRNTKKY